MPEALYLMTLLKFGLIGLSTFYSLHRIYRRLQPNLVLLLSTSFSLMSFAVSQLEILMWLDVFVLAPLILLGLHRLITEKKRWLYFISLTTLFIQNYYFGYMMAIFLTLWYLVQLSWNFKERCKSFIDFTVVSILSGLASLVMILPAVLDLRTHGETFTKISKLQTEASWWLDLLAKNLIGSYDTTKFGAIPMIYVGILPLLFALLFFTLSSIKWTVKLSYASLILFFIASFYLQPLDLFWQGMHAPNMFLHRYAWLFSLLIIFMAAESLSHLKDIRLINLLVIATGLLIAGLATFAFKKQYDYLKSVNYIISLEFLTAYVLILMAFFSQRLPKRQMTLALLLFVGAEISFNTYYQVQGLANEWHFPTREGYERDMPQITSFVKEAKKEETTFFRMERLLPQTGNDNMKYNYHGISQFSSIRNTASSQTLDKLGFKSDGTNLNLRYQNNTLIADALFGLRYNFAEQMPAKFGFSQIAENDHLKLYQNSYAAQLGLMSANPYQDVKFTNLTLDNQTDWLNQLAGTDFKYFYQISPTYITNASELGGRVTVNADPSYPDFTFASATYTLTTKRQGQIYINLPQLTFSNEDKQDVQIMVNNQLYNYTIDNAFSFFDLGHFPDNTTITVRLMFPDNNQVSYNEPQFFELDLINFQRAIDNILSRKLTTTVKDNKITSQFKADSKTSILYTIPYDQGWQAKLNGESIPIKRAQKGFVKVDVPKGKGTLELTFIPRGLVAGSLCFIGASLVFLAYDWLRRKSQKT